MSAYGVIANPNNTGSLLPSTTWPIRTNTPNTPYLTIHHLTLAAASAHPDLLEYLHAVFAAEIEAGMTYPQENEMERDAFEAYFFAEDVLVTILGHAPGPDLVEGMVHEVDLSINEARDGRAWEDCVVGFYYVSPYENGR
jgi:hypothetical protein